MASKELRLTMRLSNNRLRDRIKETKLTVAEAAELAEISYGLLCGYIALRESPIDARGRWRRSALELCDALTVTPEYLWPDTVLTILNPQIVVEMDAVDLAPQLLQSQLHEPLLLPEQILEDGEVHQLLNDELKLLSSREREVLKLRYGYEHEPILLAEIGKRLNLSHERVRQIEAFALAKLRGKIGPQVSGESLRPNTASLDSETSQIRAPCGTRRAKRRRRSLAEQKRRFKAKLRQTGA